MTIEKTELTKCSECGADFRQPNNGSTIKLKRCFRCQKLADFNKSKERIEKNKILLSQSTLYGKNKRNVKKRTDLPQNTKNGKKGLKTANIDKQLDSAWSLLVKIKAGFQCEYCKSRLNLNSHHIYSRVNKAGKWFVPNGICLCVGHHIGSNFSAHKTPIDFTLWLIDYRGQKYLDDLKLKVKSTVYMTDFEKKLLLKELKNEIKLAQSEKY